MWGVKSKCIELVKFKPRCKCWTILLWIEWLSLLEGGEPVESPALSSHLMDAWLDYQRTMGPWGICQESLGWHITASASVIKVSPGLVYRTECGWRAIWWLAQSQKHPRVYLWVVSQPPDQALGIKIPPRMQPPSHGSPQTSSPGHRMSQFAWYSIGLQPTVLAYLIVTPFTFKTVSVYLMNYMAIPL